MSFQPNGSAQIDCATFTRSHKLMERIMKESKHYIVNNYFTGSKKLNGFVERIAPLTFSENCFLLYSTDIPAILV